MVAASAIDLDLELPVHCILEHNAYKCPEGPTLAVAWSDLSYDTNLVLGMTDKILGTQFGHHMWDLWHLVNLRGSVKLQNTQKLLQAFILHAVKG